MIKFDNVYGYIRVSTKEQTTGLSLKTQTDELKRWAEYNKLTFTKIYCDEGYSGTILEEREELVNLLNSSDKNDIIVVYSIDRLSRNMKDAVRILDILRKKEVYLNSIKEDINTATHLGRFYFYLMGIITQLEVDQTIESTIDLEDEKIEQRISDLQQEINELKAQLSKNK